MRAKGWGAARAGRPVMRSLGRPPVARREHRLRFWEAIGRGLQTEEAAAEAGVSVPVAFRWFREGGGMPTITMAPLSGRYLTFAEREEIALLRARGCGVRDELSFRRRQRHRMRGLVRRQLSPIHKSLLAPRHQLYFCRHDLPRAPRT